MEIHRRQIELQGWDQNIISDLNCLILGVGGLGTNIAVDLCRLGVKTITLIDFDIVEEHNLNRQILYRKEHIGRFKVDCAIEELQRHHNISKIDLIGFKFDVLVEWGKLIELVKKTNCIFNTVDHGDYFDHFVCKLADKYSIPIILGGTEPFYGHTVSYFLQSNIPDQRKYWNYHDLKHIPEMDIGSNSEIDSIQKLIVPKDSHPIIGGSTVYSAGTCSHLMVSAIINYLHSLKDNNRPVPPSQMIFNLMTMESFFWK